MKKSQKTCIMTVGVVIIFLLSCNVSSISGATSSSTTVTLDQQSMLTKKEHAVITCYMGGMPQTQVIPAQSGLYLQELFNKLLQAHAEDPNSIETQELQQQILTYAEQNDLLPAGMSAATIQTQLQKQGLTFASRMVDNGASPALYEGTGKEMFCNFASAGQGTAFPIIILPRFIPFIMSPIPRLFVGWKTPIGVTSCGGLLSQTGFIAYGQQQGFALGFWGIGFSIFLPPINAYGMFGYALFAKTSAEYMEYWPPNNPPELNPVYPLDEAAYVPLSTTELQFHISDLDNDPMSYSVITTPDIGGGNGNLKQDGTYSIPVSGLKSLTTYTWAVTVSDGMDTTEQMFTFTTEGVAPIISDITPLDEERFVPLTQSFIRFNLRDPQNDPVDYTVETSPDIGSGSGIDVGAGYVTIPISGLQSTTIYHWFVNATDGTYPTVEEYWFQTEPVMNFDPFTEGWQYRKMVTIDHSQVIEPLSDFPVYIQTVDNDLKNHAQSDGDDILFMDGTGVAHRLWFETETYDQSTGTLVAWVKLPSLNVIDDTVFYLYYGNAEVTSQQFPEQVWDDPYRAVWHLNNNPIEGIIDSTLNNNDGTSQGGMTSSDLVTGKTGPCLDFDGINDCISFSEFTESMNTGTCIAWIKTTSDEIGVVWGEAKKTVDKPYMAFGKYSNDKLWFARDIFGSTSNYQGFKSIAMNDGQWHQVAWLSKGSGNGNSFYFDGQQTSLSWQDGYDPNGMWFDDQYTDTQSIGALDRPNSRSHWTGLLDEIRIADTPISSGWIATEYANQNTPSSFYSIGPEEPHP